MGGKVGEILIKNVEWMAHPISTLDPSKMAKALDIAPIRCGHDHLSQNITPLLSTYA
jgi:hypothetical protein